MNKSTILRTHPNEIARALRTHRYEKDEANGQIHVGRIALAGAIRVRDLQDHSEQFLSINANTLLVQGLAHLLNLGFPPTVGGYGGGVAQWFIAPYEGNYTPDGTETAATLPGTADEFTDYTAGTRLPLVFGAATAVGTRASDEVIMTFGAVGGYNVYGGSLHSVSGKGLTTGIAIASARLGSPRLAMAAGDKLGWSYAIEASDNS